MHLAKGSPARLCGLCGTKHAAGEPHKTRKAKLAEAWNQTPSGKTGFNIRTPNALTGTNKLGARKVSVQP